MLKLWIRQILTTFETTQSLLSVSASSLFHNTLSYLNCPGPTSARGMISAWLNNSYRASVAANAALSIPPEARAAPVCPAAVRVVQPALLPAPTSTTDCTLGKLWPEETQTWNVLPLSSWFNSWLGKRGSLCTPYRWCRQAQALKTGFHSKQVACCDYRRKAPSIRASL